MHLLMRMYNGEVTVENTMAVLQEVKHRLTMKVKVLVTQSCPTLCNPMDCSPPDSSVHGIFQARTHWSGLSFPSPGDLPDSGIEPRSPTLQTDALTSAPPGNTNVNFLVDDKDLFGQN